MQTANEAGQDVRRQKLYLVLCAVFLSNAILAEMIGCLLYRPYASDESRGVDA